MAKVTLNDITNLANTTSAQSTINNNNDTIEAAFDNTLSRDGSSPNSMESDIDMDSHRIINLPAPTTAGEPLRKDDQFTSAEAQSYAADAESAKNDAESALATFQGIFLGSYSSDPSTDPNGNAINEGDFYYDTTNNVVKFYNGSSFVVSESNSFFPNVDANVTATEDELNTLDGYTGSTTDLNSISGHSSALDTILNNYEEQRVELGGDFDVGEEVVLVRQGNVITVTSDGNLAHASTDNPDSSVGVIPSQFRPDVSSVRVVYWMGTSTVRMVNIDVNGTLRLQYRDWSGTASAQISTLSPFTFSFIKTGNVT